MVRRLLVIWLIVLSSCAEVGEPQIVSDDSDLDSGVFDAGLRPPTVPEPPTDQPEHE